MIQKLPPTVISLYDKTGHMVFPWAEVGYECYAIDGQHSIRKPLTIKIGKGTVTYLWGDIRTWCPELSIIRRLKFVAAFPPCTHVTVADARDFRIKGTALLRDSLEMFTAAEHAAKWAGVPYMIENPVGKFSDHMGSPDHIFDPWQYGDLYTKKTCLWTGNGFIMPEPIHKTMPPGVTNKIFTMAPSFDRADIRSETPKGFAKEVFNANAR